MTPPSGNSAARPRLLLGGRGRALEPRRKRHAAPARPQHQVDADQRDVAGHARRLAAGRPLAHLDQDPLPFAQHPLDRRIAPGARKEARIARAEPGIRGQAAVDEGGAEVRVDRAHPAEHDVAARIVPRLVEQVELDQPPVLEQRALQTERRALDDQLAAHGCGRHPRPPQQIERGRERQADHVRPAAVDRRDECLGPSLDRVAAGLAPPFPAREIGRDLALAEPLEAHHGHDRAHRPPAVGGDDRDPGVHPVPASGQQAQKALGGRAVVRLAEDAPAARHDGVGGEHVRAGRIGPGRHVSGLGCGQAQDMIPRQLAGQRRLVHLGDCDAIGDHPDLAQQGQTAGRGRGENQGCAVWHPLLGPVT